jgi:RNase H-fold protein (predicted Holliday junction resolvase)
MSVLNEKTVLAIDPGSRKLGMALVKRTSENKLNLLWHKICPVEMLASALVEANATEPYSMVIVGNGTGSNDLVAELRHEQPSIGILIVNEKDTTMQARERYWEHHPRTGWRRLLPATLQVPPNPVDDFVAMILAERVLLSD